MPGKVKCCTRDNDISVSNRREKRTRGQGNQKSIVPQKYSIVISRCEASTHHCGEHFLSEAKYTRTKNEKKSERRHNLADRVLPATGENEFSSITKVFLSSPLGLAI